jgi:hypothetical protein
MQRFSAIYQVFPTGHDFIDRLALAFEASVNASFDFWRLVLLMGAAYA